MSKPSKGPDWREFPGQYTRDCEVNQAMIRLLDALCEHERMSGRRSTLILIPHCVDEEIVVAQDGKPQPNLTARTALDLAMRERI